MNHLVTALKSDSKVVKLGYEDRLSELQAQCDQHQRTVGSITRSLNHTKASTTRLVTNSPFFA